MCIKSKLFIIVAFSFFLYSSVYAQVSISDLRPLLSSSDQKNLDKIGTINKKGNTVADQAEKLKVSGKNDKENAKNEKKFTLKRLEASQYYQKANSLLSFLLKDNISLILKKNKNLQADPVIKNKEDHASELLRQAKSTRGVAEDLIYPDEKLSKILEAENIENEANDILVKVLYAYLNRPLGYDELKYQNASKSGTDSAELREIQNLEPATSVSIVPDTLATTIPKPDSAKKDSVTPQTSYEKPAFKDTSSLYGMVNIHEDQLDKFNKFLQTSYPDTYENYVIDFRNLDYRDIESLKQAWHRYLYTGNDGVLLKKETSGKDSLQLADSGKQNHMSGATENKKDSVSRNIAETVKSPNSTGTSNKDVPNPPKRTIPANQMKENELAENKPIIPPDEKDATGFNTEITKGFLYRVQISACRIPLDSSSLRSIYSGSQPVEKLREDGWYKYAVGVFGSYGEAKELKESIKVPGAFVIAYLNGKRINIPKTDEMAHTSPSLVNGGIIYKIQILAAKKQVGYDYISHIYSGKEKVEEICEDGWYKYAIVIGNSLDEAKKFINRENIPGAFITSYIGDRKIELNEAIRLNNTKSIK